MIVLLDFSLVTFNVYFDSVVPSSDLEVITYCVTFPEFKLISGNVTTLSGSIVV